MENIHNNLTKFTEPIYVTRPFLPDFDCLVENLKEVWLSKHVTNCGPKHMELENLLCEHLKTPFLSLFNNATIALFTACNVLKLEGEVITTPFTFAATPHAIALNKLKPVFCDIDNDSLTIDTDKIEELITDKTTAILPVHVFGVPCDVYKINQIASKYNLKVIYDAAHAFGIELNGQGIAEFGNVSVFSFHATKLFNTIEGGAITTKDNQLKVAIDRFRNFGIENESSVLDIGLNGKLNELQACVGLVGLKYLQKESDKRKLLVEAYHSCLSDVTGIYFQKSKMDFKPNFLYLNIRINENEFGKSRNYIYDKLKEYNVYTRKYFHPLCSDFTCYKDISSSQKNNLPIANKVVDETLCLPLYGDLKIEEVEHICKLIKSLQHS